jgi:hypothetical protein
VGGGGGGGGGAQAAAAEQEFSRILRERLGEGESYAFEGPAPDCLSGCGRPANIKLVKRCGSCPERTECFCEPSWCHHCLLKWWLSQNQTKVEMELPFEPAWQVLPPPRVCAAQGADPYTPATSGPLPDLPSLLLPQ